MIMSSVSFIFEVFLNYKTISRLKSTSLISSLNLVIIIACSHCRYIFNHVINVFHFHVFDFTNCWLKMVKSRKVTDTSVVLRTTSGRCLSVIQTILRIFRVSAPLHPYTDYLGLVSTCMVVSGASLVWVDPWFHILPIDQRWASMEIQLLTPTMGPATHYYSSHS